MNDGMKKRYLVYARESEMDIHDVLHEISIEDQVEACKKHVEKIGGVVTKIITDKNCSGRSIERPGYQTLFDYYNFYSDRFNGVVVYEMKILTTSIDQLMEIFVKSEYDRKDLISVKEMDDDYSRDRRLMVLLNNILELSQYNKTSKDEGKAI